MVRLLAFLFFLLLLMNFSASAQTPVVRRDTPPTIVRSDEIFVGPSYLHFGDKDADFGAFGGTLEYTHWTSEKFGLTLDVGYYAHTEKETNLEQKNHIFTLSAGATYIPKLFGANSKLDLLTHALLGMVNYKTKLDIGVSGEDELSRGSFSFNLGAALNCYLSDKLDLRIIEADYIPTFFFSNTQNNFRLSTGLSFKW